MHKVRIILRGRTTVRPWHLESLERLSVRVSECQSVWMSECLSVWQCYSLFPAVSHLTAGVQRGPYITCNGHTPYSKLDGVGPVDNRPSTTTTLSTTKIGLIRLDIWHVTHDMWQMVGGLHSLKCQLSSSYSLAVLIFWRFGGKSWLTHLMNEWVTKVIVELPGYSGSAYCRLATCVA